MATIEDSSAQRGSSRAARIGRRVAVLVSLTLMTLLASVGVAALLGQRGKDAFWTRVGNVGQTFGVLGAVTLVVVVMTTRRQVRELQENRRELERQRLLLTQCNSELRRTAEANAGQLHLEMLKLAIDDPQLAEVWPPFRAGLSTRQNRQYLYANLIYQLQQTSMRIGGHTEEDVLAAMRYLFTSPIMQDYWKAAARARASLVPGSDEFVLAQKVDELSHEYEAVIAARRDSPFGSVMDLRPPDHRGDDSDRSGGIADGTEVA